MPHSILFLGAHLDDAVIAAGATIRAFVDAGHAVDVVCLGNGDEAFTTPDGREEAAARFLEDARRAHAALGVRHFECHGVPDFAVGQTRDFYRHCIRAIRRVRPAVVFGHWWAEYFQHREMARQSRDAWFQAAWDCSADLGAPWRAERYYHFEVLQDLPEPTHLVDVSAVFEAKLEAWNCFSTAHEHLGSLARQLETRAAHHGAKIGVRYAEAFRQSFFQPQSCPSAEALLP